MRGQKLSVAEVKATLSEQIREVEHGEAVLITRHGKPVAALVPIADLENLRTGQEAWASLHTDTSRPFPKPKSGRVAVKVINHLGMR